MNIAIASIFRNSSTYLERYNRQVVALRDILHQAGHTTRCIWAEGDSTDDTAAQLKFLSGGQNVQLLTVNHGGPSFGSIDNATRWSNISLVCNRVLDAVAADDDIVVYIESDLLWPAAIPLELIWSVQSGKDAIAPLCMHLPTGLFYDTWGHRKDGERFQPHPPYHPGIGSGQTPIDSAGSCIVMKGEVARTCRFDPPELGIVGFGQSIRSAGYTLWLDPSLRVLHP